MILPKKFDVLVVGGGAAGLYAALCLPKSYQIGLITKDTLPLSASDWAQGGIAAVVDPGDSPVWHIEDTMRAGAGLCDLEAVKFLVEHASECIDSLVNMGVNFDRKGENLALTLEAAHSRPRVLHAADTTGRAMVSTLSAEVLSRPNIHVIEQAFALSLWLREDDSQPKLCQGISVIYQGQVIWIRAGAVILATGGGGQVFAQTTNPSVSTGDGVAIAWRAGAMVRDLEFVQFHPTALTKPGAPRFLISEAVRGEGAHLIDNQGQRFAFDYHPSGELAPRDIVSRAIFSHLHKTASDPTIANVWLDLRPIPEDKIRHRFPNIIRVCQKWGIDVFKEPIPVTPAAHYWMGGIVADLMNRTSIIGLYALGETASTGVHGANRLASNSLLECLVFGAQMSKLGNGEWGMGNGEESTAINITYQVQDWERQRAKILELRHSLPRLMWESAGICREKIVLENAIAQVEIWQQEFANLPLSQFLLNLPAGETAIIPLVDSEQNLRTWGETYNLLDVAYLILKSAAFRAESRGGHYRRDFPEQDINWQYHTLITQQLWYKSELKSPLY